MFNGHNPKDPLIKAGREAGQELFRRFVREATDGFPRDAVVGAAANLVINAIRQEYATRDKAERAFDDLFGKMKYLLMNHYDSTGRKRGIFPYDQTIDVPFVNLKKH